MGRLYNDDKLDILESIAVMDQGHGVYYAGKHTVDGEQGWAVVKDDIDGVNNVQAIVIVDDKQARIYDTR